MATAGRLTFPAGASQHHVHRPLINDTLGEGQGDGEPRALEPGRRRHASAAPPRAVLEIQDDEPNVSLSAATYTVSEGASFLTVTVVRGGVDTGDADRGLRHRRPVPGRGRQGGGRRGLHRGERHADLRAHGCARAPSRSRSSTTRCRSRTRSSTSSSRNATISAGTVTIVSPGRAEVTITDDDIGGMIQFSALTYSVNEDGGRGQRHGGAHRRPGRRHLGAAADRRSLRRRPAARPPDRHRAGRLHLDRRAGHVRAGRDDQDRPHPDHPRRARRGHRDVLRAAQRPAARRGARHAGDRPDGPGDGLIATRRPRCSSARPPSR